MTAVVRTGLAAVGVAAVALAVGVVAGFAPESVVGPARGLDATLATGLVGAGLVGYALRRRCRSRPAAATRLVDAGEGAGATDPGQPVDGALDRIAAADRRLGDARTRIRERVRATAVRAHAAQRGVPEADAKAAVAAGEWTDDRVAAAFVGDERAPRYPLRERLRGWVRPGRAFRRRADRAAAAAHRLATEGSR